MFYSSQFTSDYSYPYFENWFIASVPHGQLITAWFLEFSRLIEDYQMEDSYLEYLNRTWPDRYDNLIQKNNAPGYLKQHVALQKLLQIDGIPLPAGLASSHKKHGPFYYLDQAGWDYWAYAKLMVSPYNKDLGTPTFFKLRSHDRNILMHYLGLRTDLIGWLWWIDFIQFPKLFVAKDSIVTKYLVEPWNTRKSI
jgi:hypothetical protein